MREITLTVNGKTLGRIPERARPGSSDPHTELPLLFQVFTDQLPSCGLASHQ
jgi:hypothetical protein